MADCGYVQRGRGMPVCRAMLWTPRRSLPRSPCGGSPAGMRECNEHAMSLFMPGNGPAAFSASLHQAGGSLEASHSEEAVHAHQEAEVSLDRVLLLQEHLLAVRFFAQDVHPEVEVA